MTKEQSDKLIEIDKNIDYINSEECYHYYYKCPNCKIEYIDFKDVYCNNCGCKFKWTDVEKALNEEESESERKNKHN